MPAPPSASSTATPRPTGRRWCSASSTCGPGIEGVIQGNYGDWINDAFKAAGQAPLAAYNDPRIVTGDPFRAPDLCLLDDFNPDYDDACVQFNNNKYWQADLTTEFPLADNVTVSTVTGVSKLDHEGVSDYQLLGMEYRRDDVESEVLYSEVQLNTTLFADAVDFVTGGNYFFERSQAPNYVINRRGTSAYPANRGHAAQRRCRAVPHRRHLHAAGIGIDRGVRQCHLAHHLRARSDRRPALLARQEGLHPKALRRVPAQRRTGGVPHGAGDQLDHGAGRRDVRADRLPGDARLRLHARHHGLRDRVQGLQGGHLQLHHPELHRAVPPATTPPAKTRAR